MKLFFMAAKNAALWLFHPSFIRARWPHTDPYLN